MLEYAAVALVCFLMLGYIYGGYAKLLSLTVRLLPQRLERPALASDAELPAVTVFVPAYNEEEIIERRLQNLAELDYPRDRLEVLVISDGSRDATDDIVRAFAAANPSLDVRLFRFDKNQGPAAGQNKVAEIARHGILVSTDAATLFEPDALRRIAPWFLDPAIGVVGGKVIYRHPEGSIGETYSQYRDMETTIRLGEMHLRIGCKTDGPFTAYRRSIWRPIEAFEDVDHVGPLLARSQGLLTAIAVDAVAYDDANENFRQEFRQRSRMTRKGLLSIFNRLERRFFWQHPGFVFAVMSHRIVRLFSPLFLLGFILFGALAVLSAVGPAAFSAMALAGALALMGVWTLPALAQLKRKLGYFAVTNTACLHGIWGWTTAQKAGAYTPTRQIAAARPSTSQIQHARSQHAVDELGLAQPGGGQAHAGERRLRLRGAEAAEPVQVDA